MATARRWPRIVVYDAAWCSDCARTVSFLEAHDVPHEYHDVEEEGLESLVVELNEKAGKGPLRRVPRLLVDDRAVCVPSNGELASLLGV